MALNRFYNIQQIIRSRSLTQGLTISERDLEYMSYDIALIEELQENSLNIESHVYSIDGEYLLSKYNTPYSYTNEYRDFLFDSTDLFNSLNLINGSYKVNFVFHKNLLGTPETLPLFVNDISPDRTELKLTVKQSYRAKNPSIDKEVESFKEIATLLKSNDKINNLVVNFGKNNIQQIVNIKVCCSDDYTLCIKLYSPLLDEIQEKQSCCIDFKILEDYIESFLIKPNEIPIDGNVLRGPNFNQLNSCNETGIEYWDSLLDTDSTTTTSIINNILSGSNSVKLNIDWTNINNYVIYGSAEERIRNYNYKLQLIEYYASQSAIINSTNASGSSIIYEAVNNYSDKSNIIVSNFDQFEQHLYYDTGSIFTHDITGSIVPSPKRIISGKVVNYPTTSSIYTSWYNTMLSSSIEFDRTNYNSLYYNTPDHILRDPNNSEYITFIHMIGQHFDNIYAYIRELTSIHKRDEHPKRGIPNELLPHYARSLGWKLKTSHNISNLWNYKLGTNASGSMSEATGSLPSKSYEDLNYQVWRRIVNNLPYLLKTKGTERSIRALLSIYGIPNTLISIKEYGGPSIVEDKPNLIEDRFQYALNLVNDQYIEFDRRPGIPFNSDIEQIPQTVEFRFKTNYTSSVSMSLWSIEESKNRTNVLHNLELVHSGSMYGSNTYGYLRYTATEGFPYAATTELVATSSLLPLYDNDFWSVKISSATPIYSGSAFDGTLMIDVAKASDFTDNRISMSSSFEVTGDPYSMLYALGAVARTYFSSSFDNIDNISYDAFTGGRYGLVVQARDEDDEVFIPYNIFISGSNITVDFDSINLSGLISSIPGTAFTASLTNNVEYTLNHQYSTSNIIAQVSDISSNRIIPSEIRIIDPDNLGITVTDDIDAKIVIIASGSLTYPDTSVSVYPFALSTQVTQSTSEVQGANIVQIFDENGLAILPESVIVDDLNQEIRLSFGLSQYSGSIHLAVGEEIDIESNPHHVLLGGTTGSNSNRFRGSIQGYKEYYGYYDRNIFYEHTLNPGAYYGISLSSSYDQLFRYYPLGIDNIRYNHSTSSYYIISSSHPNQDRTADTLATFYNFSGSQSDQYFGFSEKYYTYRPIIGAHNPKSNKIRLESSTLVKPLSPSERSQVSLYDSSQADTNKLAIVFSPTDQINRDIANQLGPHNFQDYIADPSDEGKDYYPSLQYMSNDYYKKYDRANDLGKYIEIFSLFDFSVFQQMHQLIPARSNTVTGVLIEPTLLERSKIRRKQPSISLHSYDTTLSEVKKEPTSNYIETHQAILSRNIDIEIDRIKYTSSLSTPITLNVERSKHRANISSTSSIDIQGSTPSHVVNDGNISSLIANYNLYNGSIYSNCLNVVTIPTTSSFSYKRNGIIYTTTIHDNKNKNLIGEVDIVDYSESFNSENIIGSFITKNSSNDEVPFVKSYIGDSNYTFEITTVKPNILTAYSLDGEDFETFLSLYGYEVKESDNFIYIKINSGNLYANYITGSRTNNFYQKVNYYYSSSGTYSSDYEREFQSARNKLNKQYHSSSLENWNYQYNEDSSIMRCRFAGSKLTGGGINIDSVNTISGGPVVTVTVVNENQIIV